MRRPTVCFLFLLFACDDDDTPAQPGRADAAVDGGIDSGIDAGRDGAVDARVESADARAGDAGDGGTAVVDSGVGDAQAAACEESREFVASHKGCASDDDCVIVGSCSGGFGFAAVQTSAAAQAQAYSNAHPCGPVYDGPLFEAACEQSKCVSRANGRWCGMAPSDAGTMSGCAVDQVQYRVSCDAPFVCRTRCAGATATTCGTDSTCTLETVSRSTQPYDTYCEPKLEVWLCSL